MDLQKVQIVNFLTQAGSFLNHPTLCRRCYDVIAGQPGRALAAVTCAPGSLLTKRIILLYMAILIHRLMNG